VIVLVTASEWLLVSVLVSGCVSEWVC